MPAARLRPCLSSPAFSDLSASKSHFAKTSATSSISSSSSPPSRPSPDMSSRNSSRSRAPSRFASKAMANSFTSPLFAFPCPAPAEPVGPVSAWADGPPAAPAPPSTAPTELAAAAEHAGGVLSRPRLWNSADVHSACDSLPSPDVSARLKKPSHSCEGSP